MQHHLVVKKCILSLKSTIQQISVISFCSYQEIWMYFAITKFIVGLAFMRKWAKLLMFVIKCYFYPILPVNICEIDFELQNWYKLNTLMSLLSVLYT